MSTQSRLQTAHDLIRQQRYAEARTVLQPIASDPTAARWLAKLDEIAPASPSPFDDPFGVVAATGGNPFTDPPAPHRAAAPAPTPARAPLDTTNLVVYGGCGLVAVLVIGMMTFYLSGATTPKQIVQPQLALTLSGGWYDVGLESTCQTATWFRCITRFAKDPDWTEVLADSSTGWASRVSIALVPLDAPESAAALEAGEWEDMFTSTDDTYVDLRELTPPTALRIDGRDAVRRTFFYYNDASRERDYYGVHYYIADGLNAYYVEGWSRTSDYFDRHLPEIEQIIASIDFDQQR